MAKLFMLPWLAAGMRLGMAWARAPSTRSTTRVLVSTLPTTLSRWLRQDLPHRISRKVDVPVAVVTSA